MHSFTTNSTYVLQHAPKSHCPKCGRSVDLLCQRNPTDRIKPWFYICFACELICQVGKGEVPRETKSYID